MMMKLLMAMVACGALAGCATGQPESQAQQADDAACTAQADTIYNMQNMDTAGRSSQPGLLYGATPTHVFDAEQLGALHQRDSQITDCERTGNNNGAPEIAGTPVVTPHIIGTP